MSAFRVFRQGLVVGRGDFRHHGGWRGWMLGGMLRITSYAFIWVLLGEMLGSLERRNFLLVGNAVMAGPAAVAITIAAATWERFWSGTHPLLVAAPASMAPAIIGRTSVWLFNGLGTSLGTFAILGTAFGLPFRARSVLVLPLLILLVCISAYCSALFIGALVNVAPRGRIIAQHVWVTVLMAFCGVNVPASFWPRCVQSVADIFPVTHGLLATRLLLGDGRMLAVVRESTLELLVGLGWLALSVFTVDWLAEAGRSDGSLARS